MSGNYVVGTQFTAQTKGTYTVSVYAGSSNVNAAGVYDLYWTIAPRADACGVLLSGRMATNQLTPGALDSYTFNAQAGEGVALDVVSGGAISPMFNLYDPTGATIVDGASGLEVAGTSFQTQIGGTYTVVVYENLALSPTSGSYNLYFVRASGDGQGVTLTPGEEAAGQLAEGALDVYTFTAQVGEGVGLSVVSGGAIEPSFNVYDPTGANIVDGASGIEVAGTSFQTSTAGTYTVLVYDHSGRAASGPYDVTLALTPAP